MAVSAVVEPGPSVPSQAGSQPARPIVIRLEQLTKVYTEGDRQHVVLDELNREFYTGEFVALLGKSGSGKSTLLNLISGIDSPTNGTVAIVAGGRTIPLTTLGDNERTLFRRRHIGIVFQFFNLIPTLTVLENVSLPLELNGESRARPRPRRRTARTSRPGRPPANLSR